ncbi:hypothetical protein EIP86_002501 [Pleurotus ostreatoroseus]|nr:hypothetical protein EIP86_002501 [Pleurotus ostreatoroseus]
MARTKPVVVVDNGGSTIKLGILGKSEANARVIQNAIIRSKGDKTTYFGQDFADCKDFSSLNYRLPIEKGYIVDWDAQKAIWDGLFTSEYLGVDPPDASLLMTEPYFNLPNLQEVYDQFVFEEYEFEAYFRCTPASLVRHGRMFSHAGLPSPDCLVVVDAGFSYTHVVPIMGGDIVWSAVKRIDIGGKLLTNQLKELVSFRQWNMMDETYIMNDVKEKCCYVSLNFHTDLETCRSNVRSNTIVQEYILPDFSANRSGRIRSPGEPLQSSQQILSMSNERFSVPESLFRPDDIGLEQVGIASAIADSISTLPEDLQGMFWANIGLIGGSTKFPGFQARLQAELRAVAPVECDVAVYTAEDPILEAYYSALAFVKSPSFTQQVVTKAEYMESGSNATRRKFKDWKPVDQHGKDKEVHKARTTAKSYQEDLEEDFRPPKASTRGRGRGRGRGTGTTRGSRGGRRGAQG